MRVTQITQVSVIGAITVSVSAPPKAYEGIPVTVSASWDAAVGPFDGVYYWGDGASDIINTTSKSVSKAHTYAAAGAYSVKVVVKDRNTGSQGEGTAPIQIAAKLSATLSASPSSGNVPLTTTFTMGASGGYTPYTATLAYGDGITDTVSPPGTKAHTYTTVGTFTATLTVTDALGATAVRLLDLFAGVVPPWLPDWVFPFAGLVPLLFVGSTIVANELQRARIIG